MALVWLMNSLEMPLANVCGHGDVRIPARDVIMKCCKKSRVKSGKFGVALMIMIEHEKF